MMVRRTADIVWCIWTSDLALLLILVIVGVTR